MALALSKIGKEATATTTTVLIDRFGARQIVFAGVAGRLGVGVKIGDVVVAAGFLQHDLDASPLLPRYEVPLFGNHRIACNAVLNALLVKASYAALARSSLSIHGFQERCVHQGLIASGDRFACNAEESSQLAGLLAHACHDVLAVEMESAAVAQVCLDYGAPFAVMRTISDRVDDSTQVDFPDFMKAVASPCAQLIMENF